jgi:hypothetical protein
MYTKLCSISRVKRSENKHTNEELYQHNKQAYVGYHFFTWQKRDYEFLFHGIFLIHLMKEREIGLSYTHAAEGLCAMDDEK